ncbi:MAG: cell division protein FtsB, partial [Gammaproteobacteria bacterium]
FISLLLIILLAALQYRLWIGNGSLTEVHHLEQTGQGLQDEIKQLQERNRSLAAEVNDLKHGNDAIEERARTGMGMIRKDEVFYQLIHQQAPAAGKENVE